MKKRIKLNPEISIVDLVAQYPDLVEILQNDYEFHCVNCMFSEFDTLEAGAGLHGIEGDEFKEMLARLEEIINS